MASAVHELQPQAELHWRERDPLLAGLSQAYPLEPFPLIRGDAFGALVQAFGHQQVAAPVGFAVAQRLEARLGEVTAARVLGAGAEALREAGLSRQKAACILDLAAMVESGELRLDEVAALPDDEAVLRLSRLPGVGAWTAKVFLLFHVGRPDVFIPEDPGLRQAVAAAYGVGEAEAVPLMQEMRQVWAPYNSVAARVLWRFRRVSEDGAFA
jgi:DNA-3-methyladenine glycosylase II